MPYNATVWDYVSWKKSDGDLRYGQVTATAKDTITVKPADATDKEKDGITKSVSEFTDIARSAYARMSARATTNVWELAENTILFTLYSSFWMRNKAMGAENISFFLADAFHEFITKGYSEQFMSFLEPTYLVKDADSWFLMSDLSDAARKIPFVFGFQQLIQKFMFKKHMGHQAMSNLLGGFSVLSVSNFGDRMAFSDKKKTPQ